ncbi:MAG: sigma-70 family RNA polymerase sigma factor [Planctomycetota bacterium]
MNLENIPHTTTATLDPEDWVDAYGDRFFQYALRRLQDVQAAEEVVQEAFLAGFRYRDSFNGNNQLAWLLTILKHKIVDSVRMRDKVLEESWGGERDPTALLFDEQGNWRAGALPKFDAGLRVDEGELWDVVQNCLQGISPLLADVFVLTVVEEMETKEICRELDISPSNLAVRLHRARLQLAKCVASKWNVGSLADDIEPDKRWLES